MRSPDTPAQLGVAERARAVIVTVARVIRIYASLPKALTNKTDFSNDKRSGVRAVFGNSADAVRL
jgi:hypothetical protein